MKLKHYSLLLGASVLCLTAGAVHAEGTRPTEAKMKAVHDCAASNGVEMPTPPAGAPPKGEKPAKPPEGGKEGDGKGPHGPKLTDAQKAIMDACFAEQGLTPPKGPPHGGEGRGGKGPRPEGGQAPAASE
ncbi:MAG: hypothetical protein PHD48_00970 [Alphaproteobacteria bacterium]|nr:hypothetical protein [Alphaproteobacteria bacterium]